MKRKNIFQLLGYFLKERLPCIVYFIMFFGILSVVYFLYEVRFEPFLYAMMLCAAAAVLIFAVRFFFYCREHYGRLNLFQNINIEYDNITTGKTLSEREYIAMIQRLGEQGNRVLSQFQNSEKENIEYYSAWVHQIKTPISVMQMILQSNDTAENRQLLSELFRIEQYVNMALCYVRLDSVTTDFVFIECDLDKIVKNVIHKFAPQFIGKRIVLKYEPVNVKALTDEKWLSFILEQIISNAVKYTYKGSVTISVSEDKKISVSDTGIGIAKEDLPRIFDKGFTGYNGRENMKSTGLGLYLCKKTADKISAEITAESEIGKGSTFIVDLQANLL